MGQPIGSLLSGIITDAIGRRKTMLLVNFPNVVAWLLLAQTETLPVIYFAFGLFGIGAGLMEAPIMTYLSEIWWVFQPNLILDGNLSRKSLSFYSVNLQFEECWWRVVAYLRHQAFLWCFFWAHFCHGAKSLLFVLSYQFHRLSPCFSWENWIYRRFLLSNELLKINEIFRFLKRRSGFYPGIDRKKH